MKSILPGLLQGVLATVLLAGLTSVVHRATPGWRVTTPEAPPERDAVYGAGASTGQELLVVAHGPRSSTCLLVPLQPGSPAPRVGQPLHRLAGSGPDVLVPAAIVPAHAGLPRMTATLGRAARAPLALTAAFALIGVCLLLTSLRWSALLQAERLTLPLRRVLLLTLTGQFFSSLLPGATSGDVVKAFYTARATPGRRAEAAMTVFSDRFLGILSLLLLASGIGLAQWQAVAASVPLRIGLTGSVGASLLLLVFLVAAFHRDWFEHWAFFRRLEANTRAGDILARAYRSLQRVVRAPALLACAVGLSLANHLMPALAAPLLGHALGVELPLRAYLVVVPLLSAVAAVPLTPGGLGTREGAAIALFAAYGLAAHQAFALSLLLYAIMLLWSLVGGLTYALTLRREAHPPSGDPPTQFSA